MTTSTSTYIEVQFVGAGTYKGKNLRTIINRVFHRSYGYRTCIDNGPYAAEVLDPYGYIVDRVIRTQD